MWAAGLQGAGAQAPWPGRESWVGGGSGGWLQSSSNVWSVPCPTSIITFHQLKKKKGLFYLETKHTGDWFRLCSKQAILCLDGGRCDVIFPPPSCSAAALLGAQLLARPQSMCGGISALGNSMLLSGWRESRRCTRQQSRIPSLPVLPYKGILWWCCKPVPSHRFSTAAAAQQSQARVWIPACCDNQLGFGKSFKKSNVLAT